MVTSNLNSTQIKSIPLDQPERLFRDRFKLKADMLALSHKWNPDALSDKSKEKEYREVVTHITSLYVRAKEKHEKGYWEDPESVIISIPSVGLKKFNYLRKHTFELGRIYVGSKRIVIFLTKESEDGRILFYHYVSGSEWKFANDKMAEDIKKYLPHATEITSESNERGFLLEKTPELLMLKDVNTYFGNKIPIPHIFWIISRCMNLACWLEYAGIFYGGFFTENLFINPEKHSVSLLGGWWYSHQKNKKLTVASLKTVEVVPDRLLADRTAKPIMDRYLIRRLAGELLGDPTGQNLIRNSAIAQPIEHWINMPPLDSAVDDYNNWYQALESAYGPRKFTELVLTEKDIYT